MTRGTTSLLIVCCVSLAPISLRAQNQTVQPDVAAAKPGQPPPANPAPAPPVAGQAQPTTPTSTPPLIEGLSAAAGAAFNFRAGLGTSSYYNVAYKGRTLSEHGTTINYLDATHQFDIPSGDNTLPSLLGGSQSFLFNLATGSVTGSGDFFNALGVNSFLAPRLNLSPFRATGGVNGTLDGRQINAALGIETPSLHLRLHRQRRSIASVAANWLNFGIAGQQQFQHGFPGAQNHLSGIATYRGFIGNAFNWRPSNARSMPFTVDEFLNKYPTLKAVQAVPLKPVKDFPDLLTSFTVALANFEGLDDASYRSMALTLYNGLKKGYLLEPTWAIWVESNGQYNPTGPAQGDRFKNNLAVVLTYWWDLGRTARSQVQLRYENGYPTAGSLDKVDRVVLSLGLNF